MANERNKLKAGVSSLLGRAGIVQERQDVELSRRGGRPPKDKPSGWNSSRDYRTSLVVDREQYSKIRRLSNITGQTVKQLMYLLLEEGLASYESGHLKIANLRDESI